ncbi:MAG TPA: hypothetical protein VG711_04415 [Phycisphaerales bacterium]|nr:hypothetical protein [Phycisphaerales bacterium]
MSTISLSTSAFRLPPVIESRLPAPAIHAPPRTKAVKRAPSPPPSCAPSSPISCAPVASGQSPQVHDESDAAWNKKPEDLQVRLDRREMIEQLLQLADFLKPSDRALMRGIFGSGMSPQDMAAAMEQQTRQVRARVRKLLRHLAKPVYRFVAREHASWPNYRKSVARAVVLQRISQREAARELGITLHRVRRELDRIRGIVDDALGAGSLKISSRDNDADDSEKSGDSGISADVLKTENSESGVCAS